MPAIHWWQSRTIWAALVAALAGGLALTGHTIDPGTQANLIDGLANAANAIGTIAALAAAYYRTQSASAIKPQILPAAITGKPEAPVNKSGGASND